MGKKHTHPKIEPTKGATRPPLERMMALHQAIKAGRYPNCRKLSETMEVSPKTLQRDIEFMRSRLGLPIEYDAGRFGYYYSMPVSHFPSIEISEGEMVALFVAQKALEQYKGTPFEAPLHAAFQKVTEGLQENVSFPWADLDSSFSFRGIGTTEADLALFEALSKAVLRMEELAFDYCKLGGTDFEPRRVHPYHLGSVENQWYLFAFDLDRQQQRTFALPRICSPRPTGSHFVRPADFDIATHLGGSFGVFQDPSGSEASRFTIRLQFDAFASRLISERQWHPSQQITLPTPAKGEEGCVLTLQLANIEEISGWILSWGHHVRVLAPEELRTRVREEAAALLASHSAPETS